MTYSTVASLTGLGPAVRQLVTGQEPDERYPVPDARTFIAEDGSILEFVPAPDLEFIAERLIEARNALWPARDQKIRVLWKCQGGADAGRATMGKTIRTSGLVRYWSDTQFVIWLAADHVRAEGFSRWQVEGLLFHELLHIHLDEKGKAGVIGHDAELFLAEFSHYGLWDRRLELVSQAAIQLQLPGAAER